MTFKERLTPYFTKEEIDYLISRLEKSDLSNKVIDCLIDYFIMLHDEHDLTHIAIKQEQLIDNNHFIYINSTITKLTDLTNKPLLQIPIIVYSTINKYKTFYYKSYFVEMTKHEAEIFFKDRAVSLKNQDLQRKELESEKVNLPDYESYYDDLLTERYTNHYNNLATDYYEDLKRKSEA